MAKFGEDILTRLAFTISENKGVYALLLGSGISQSSSIPTGWEITIDLIRRYAQIKNPNLNNDDWED